LFVFWLIAGAAASFCVCILAQKPVIAVLVLVVVFISGILFAINADRQKKHREEMRIKEYMQQEKLKKNNA